MATGRLLAALPLAGVGLAAALGTSAPRFLFGSLPGQLSLLLAAILESTGLLWLERLQPGGQR
jgi:tight adherence protein B